MTESGMYIGVDLGASSGRVMAGAVSGGRLALRELHRFANGPVERDGSFRWDAPAIFSEIEQGIVKAAAAGERVVSIGVDTWGVDYGLLDGAGALIDLPYAYRDPRTEGMMDEAFRRVPRRALYETTGLQFMFFNTAFQLLAEVTAARPELARAERLLFMPDLLNYWLSGRAVNEYSIASTSQLLDARSRTWATGLIGALGLPRRLFGELVMPGTRLGPLRAEVCARLGVEPFEVVAVGGHDTASAVAAVPAVDDTPCAYLSSGTWSLMGVEVPTPVITDATFAIPFTNEGGVCDTIRLLRNIGGLWLVQECRRHWAARGEDIAFADLSQLAAEAEPFVAVIDPDAAVFAAPGDMPDKIRAFAEQSGQRVPQTKGEVVRTALESLALRYRWVFERLERVGGRRLERLHIVGGGSQNQVLNQFTANAVGRPVLAGPVEATAIGNILMQLLAAGVIGSLAEGRRLVADSFGTQVYEPADGEIWAAAYDRFLEVVS